MEATSQAFAIIGGAFVGFCLGVLVTVFQYESERSGVKRELKRLEDLRKSVSDHEDASRDLLQAVVNVEKSVWEFWQRGVEVYREMFGGSPPDGLGDGSKEAH